MQNEARASEKINQIYYANYKISNLFKGTWMLLLLPVDVKKARAMGIDRVRERRIVKRGTVLLLCGGK